MVNTTARIKKVGKHFEIMVDLDDALKFRKGTSSFIKAETEFIFHDIKKGEKASEKDLKEAFGTTDVNEIVKKIVKDGEIQTTQEFRDAEQEKRFKQVVDFLVKNAYDPQTGRPHTTERIKNALEQANVNIKNTSIENQISEILEKIRNELREKYKQTFTMKQGVKLALEIFEKVQGTKFSIKKFELVYIDKESVKLKKLEGESIKEL